MSTEKNSFFLQFQLLLDAYQQRSHIKTSHRVIQQYRCYYCPKEFQTFSETIDHTCFYHQDQKIKIKIVKTFVCLFGCLCLGRSGIALLKPRCWNRPVITYAHLNHVDRFALSPCKKMWTPRAQRRDWWENEISALYTPSPGFKAILSKCLFLYVFIVTLTFDPYFLIMDNIWTKLITGLYVFHKVVSIFVHCDLDLSSLTLKINRDHPLTMDNKSTCSKFDQDELNSLISIVFKR